LANDKTRASRRNIPTPSIPGGNRRVQFSFRHLQTDNPKFCPEDCPVEFLRSLVDKLRVYSNLDVDEFLDQNNKERRHQIFFEEPSEKDGFVGAPGVDKDQLGYLEAWQFQLCEQTEWRVHGFISDDTFYIVC
jgi:hypothetical protein